MQGLTRKIAEKYTLIRRDIELVRLAYDNIINVWRPSDFEVEIKSFRLLNRQLFIVNDPDLVERVMVTHVNLYPKSDATRAVLEPLIGDGMFISHGDIWRHQRRIATPAFHTRHIRVFAESISRDATAMLERWSTIQPGDEVEINKEMGGVAATVIVRTLFSDDLGANSEPVFQAFTDYQKSLGRIAIGELIGLPGWVPRLHKRAGHRAVAKLDAIVDEIVAKRRRSRAIRHDLLGTLLDSVEWDDGAESTAFVREMLKVMLLAGHESTANTMSWALFLISTHPECARTLYAEIDAVLQGSAPTYADVANLSYLRAVLQETLRLFPPIHVYSRQATRSDQLREFHVPKGSMIIISPWLIHRHRKLWDAPEEFQPKRFLEAGSNTTARYAYIPFGSGPRTCLGSAFAMVEMAIVLAMILQRYHLTLRPGHSRATGTSHSQTPLRSADDTRRPNRRRPSQCVSMTRRGWTSQCLRHVGRSAPRCVKS